VTRIALAASAFCLIGQAAFAHALLERAVPAIGSEVAQPPSALQLTYSEAVEPAFSKVEVTDAGGKRVDKNEITSRDDRRVVVVPLKPLAPGTYTVKWQVTSADTHQTRGHFSFTLRP
jgi:copper resistance protein C